MINIEEELNKFDCIDEDILKLIKEFNQHKIDAIKNDRWEEAAAWRDKERNVIQLIEDQ